MTELLSLLTICCCLDFSASTHSLGFSHWLTSVLLQINCSDNTLDKDDKPVVIILLPTATLVLCPIVAVTAVSPITPLGVVAVVPLHITQLIDLKACMKTYVLLTTLILVVP